MTQAPSTSLPVAEIDRRFYAFAIDRLIAWSIDGLAVLLAWRYLIDRDRVALGLVVVVAVVMVVGVVFAVLLGVRGTTPGKSLVGLRAVHFGTGSPIGVRSSLLRSLILGVAAVPTFGFGVAALAWTAVVDGSRMRRAWHDHVAQSVVVDARPAPPPRPAEDPAPRHVVNLTAMRLVPAGPPAEVPTPPPPVRQPRTPSQATPTPGRAAPHPAAEPVRPLAAERTQRRDPANVPTSVPTSLPQPPAPAHWGLAFDTGEQVLLEGLALIGRRPEARPGEQPTHLIALPSADMSLSKTHAQVTLAPDGALVVTDRGSTNGSVLLRHGVAKPLSGGRPTTLLEGDEVRLGDRRMTIHLVPRA